MQLLKEIDLAWLAIVGHKALFSHALRLYRDRVVLFSPLFNYPCSVMWGAYLRALKEYKDKVAYEVSRDLISANIAEALEGDRNIGEDQQELCAAVLKRFREGDFPPQEEGLELLKKLIELDSGRKMAEQVSKSAGMDRMKNVLDARDRSLELVGGPQAAARAKVLYNPFQEIATLAIKAYRIPTGINWMDKASSGGGRAGELWLILGPSGGGKTAIAVQYACSQGLMGNDTVWATYEQSLEGDISERIISYVTGHSLDDIRDVGFNNLSEEIRDKFYKSVANTQEKLKVLDMTKMEQDPQDAKDNGGIYSVWKQVKVLKARGIKVKTVIVDWFGSMMSLVGSVMGRDLSNGYRFFGQAEIDIARRMVKEEDLQIIFFHQTDSKSQHARPTYVPDKTCAKDMKDMCNYMDLVFTMSNKDRNNIIYFTAAKSRKGEPISQTIQLIGDRSKFIMVDGWQPNRDGHFYRFSDMETGGGAQVDRQRMTAASYSREIE